MTDSARVWHKHAAAWSQIWRFGYHTNLNLMDHKKKNVMIEKYPSIRFVIHPIYINIYMAVRWLESSWASPGTHNDIFRTILECWCIGHGKHSWRGNIRSSVDRPTQKSVFVHHEDVVRYIYIYIYTIEVLLGSPWHWWSICFFGHGWVLLRCLRLSTTTFVVVVIHFSQLSQFHVCLTQPLFFFLKL